MSSSFKINSKFNPTGDQPKAIEALLKGLNRQQKFQTLEGVTGSGKTFTMANTIARYGRPALVLCHNKTLAAQLYAELKDFFPTMPLNILYHTTTTINPKPTSPNRHLYRKRCLH